MALILSKACFILVFMKVPFSLGYTRLNLNGTDWTIYESSTGQIKGTVPGTPYTAMYSQGKIQNPLYRDNDLQLAWMGRAAWSYSTRFTATREMTTANQALLVCEGLDTFATLYLNGKMIGTSDNMFKRWLYDVTGVLQEGNNNLMVNFTSPVLEANAKAKLSNYTIPPVCSPPQQHGECQVNQIRKEQCSFAWDWGPSFPTSGIWRPIYIETFSSAVMRDLAAVVSKENGVWYVNVEVFFDVVKGANIRGTIVADVANLNLRFVQDVLISFNQNVYTFKMAVPATTAVPLWWPHGYGNQPLFSLNVRFTSGQDVTSRSLRIGFKTVELIQVPVTYGPQADSSKGLTFYYKVNGIPIFLKGTNWIPADSFLERVTRDRLFYLLSSAVDVGVNSMRVWGGGIYEMDELYDICDELGILIWQDLMFSVAYYPTYPEFLQSVSDEVRYQIRRLKHHASVLVWAGSNENEKALVQNWFKTLPEDNQRYRDDFIKLYVTTIMPIVTTEDPTRTYLSSSPSDGLETVRQGYIATDPGSALYGDIHYYDYKADQWNASVFRIPRMASEYGVQAWCSIESLAKVWLPSDLSISSQMAQLRQHHPNGHAEMLAEVSAHLKLPQTSDPKLYFEEFIYLTQINQAMSIRTQSEHYRRFQSHVRSDGHGLTMGALYWQLNDIWQAPTWASIDYEGRWKMLHYYARSFFSKHLISPYMPDKDTLDVYIVVDEIPIMQTMNGSGYLSMVPMRSQQDVVSSGLSQNDVNNLLQRVTQLTSGKLMMYMYQYSRLNPIYSWTVPYNIKTTAESVLTKPIQDLISESRCPGASQCFLYFTATDQAGNLLSTNWLTLTYPKDAALRVPNLRIQYVNQKDTLVFDIVVVTDVPAMFVWLSTGDIVGRFSDNGFLMIQPRVMVQFFAQKPTTMAQLQAQLKVRSVK